MWTEWPRVDKMERKTKLPAMTVNIIQKLNAEIARVEANITPGTNEEMAYALSAEVRAIKRQIRDLRRSAEQSTSS
jgi:predicted  nucleic acid-binding Zn-ribbon protein